MGRELLVTAICLMLTTCAPAGPRVAHVVVKQGCGPWVGEDCCVLLDDGALTMAPWTVQRDDLWAGQPKECSLFLLRQLRYDGLGVAPKNRALYAFGEEPHAP